MGYEFINSNQKHVKNKYHTNHQAMLDDMTRPSLVNIVGVNIEYGTKLYG